MPVITDNVLFLILNDHYEDYEAMRSYFQGQRTTFAWRARQFSKDHAVIAGFDTANQPYFFTGASSDFTGDLDPLYQSAADVTEVVGRTACKGLYMHEVATYEAAVNYAWDWTASVAALDWTRITAFLSAAAAAGKPVVWSEPAEAWAYIKLHASLVALMPTYAPYTLVPMYGTNFESEPSGYHMQAALEGVQAMRAAYGVKIGQSHQTWYFNEQFITITAERSFRLALAGYNAGCRVIQFEGESPDIEGVPLSAYLAGARDLALHVNSRQAVMHRPGRPGL